MDRIKIIVITGPTASGKSSLAVELARVFNAEIISADSMQVYKHLDIGTAKPSEEERALVPHHLIDAVMPGEDYTAARFTREAADRIAAITGRGRNVFVVGGTGLYIKALTKGICDGPEADNGLRQEMLDEARRLGKEALHERLRAVDPRAAAAIHPNNLRRVVRALEVCLLSGRPLSEMHKAHGFSEEPYDALKIGLFKERERLYMDIEERVDRMMERGLLAETARLLDMGFSPSLKPMLGLGYREMAASLRGEVAVEEAVRLLKRNTRRYAKRQMTWFRKDPEIKWFKPEEKDGIINTIKGHLCLKEIS